MKKLTLFFLICLIILVPVFIVKNRSITPQSNLPIVVNTATVTLSLLKSPTNINNLPDNFLINTTFIPQAPEKIWDQPWQDACEEAALLTVKYYYSDQTPDTTQIVNDLSSIFQFEAENNLSHDVNLAQMADNKSHHI